MECLTLKKSNCKNCYKCIRHCPVKSIRFTGNQAYIIGDECIMCGQCFVVCPQNAKQITDETEKVKVFLQGSDPVVVSLAPSFVANFDGVGIESMRDALKQLGFYDVEETAIGALGLYISKGSIGDFQPMNINFGIISSLDYRVKGKRNKNAEISRRALNIIDELIGEREVLKI